MGAVFSWVVSLLTLIPGRVLFSLGFGVLTFTGYKVAVDSIVSSVVNSVNSLPTEIYNIAALGGFVTGFGIVLAAIVARAGLLFLDRFGKISS